MALSIPSFCELYYTLSIESEILESEFPKNTSNILNPFSELQWDQSNPISEQMIPKWWIAYKK